MILLWNQGRAFAENLATQTSLHGILKEWNPRIVTFKLKIIVLLMVKGIKQVQNLQYFNGNGRLWERLCCQNNVHLKCFFFVPCQLLRITFSFCKHFRKDSTVIVHSCQSKPSLFSQKYQHLLNNSFALKFPDIWIVAGSLQRERPYINFQIHCCVFS